MGTIRSWQWRWRWAVGAIPLVLMVASCSGDDSDTAADRATADTAAAESAAATGAPAETMIAAAETTAAAATAESADADGIGGGGVTPVDPSDDPTIIRAVISTASLTVTVDDVTDAAAAVRAAAAAAGGFVASSEESAEGDGAAVVTIKVPPGDFARLLDELGGLGEVAGRQIDSQDVTDQVVDLDARIGVMNASVDRLIALIDQTNNIGEIAALEAELTRRTADMESLQGQLRVIESQVALSTITVTLQPVPLVNPEFPTLVGAVRTNPTFADGVRAGWDALVSSGRDASVVVGAVLPWLLPSAVIGLVLVGVRRRVRRCPAPATPPTPVPVGGP